MTKKILVLQGADSPEREVSIRSGGVIAKAARAAGYDVKVYDPIDGEVGLQKVLKDVDVVLPILHGVNGEDGSIQQYLERQHIKFLGSSSEVSRVCFDKMQTQKTLTDAGIRMPNAKIVGLDDLNDEMFSEPFVLKPVAGGSAIDTLICREHSEEIIEEVKNLLLKYESMLLQELIVGTEISIPVLGEDVLPVIAIKPPEGEEFDYENRYNGKSDELCPAPNEVLALDTQKEAQEIALRAHKLLGARHLSRTDMLVSNKGDIYLLELNTIPGLTEQSLMPKSAAVAGYDMVKLVNKFVELTEQ